MFKVNNKDTRGIKWETLARDRKSSKEFLIV